LVVTQSKGTSQKLNTDRAWNGICCCDSCYCCYTICIVYLCVWTTVLVETAI